ncbi:transposase [Bradyrhizobium sp. LMTR 3]|uniref:transposase n=1 Tax=Bradyrhizobium sp. LMTR 3 TaxID=189873 RepID=UPI0024BF44E4|nr:transposase [Bradyrhizobium sp. LMTR 3]
MTVTKIRTDAVKQLLASDKEFLKPLIQAAVQEMLEAEMAETLGAEKGERTEARLGYRSGYYTRSLLTRLGKIELKVPQDRQHCSSAISARRRRWLRHWPSCTCRASRRGR